MESNIFKRSGCGNFFILVYVGSVVPSIRCQKVSYVLLSRELDSAAFRMCFPFVRPVYMLAFIRVRSRKNLCD